MRWSFPIGTLAGSEVRIHLTFFLLLAWIGFAHYQEGGMPAAWEGVLFICAVFACVVLHELGHAVAAKRYGIKTPRITLLPIGGLAELERMPKKPSEEIMVAIAGPLVNVAIAAILIVGFGAAITTETIAAMQSPAREFINRLAAVNIVLVVFNMIPAFPMDGGRVLRALLATRHTHIKATNIAASIGQVLAFVFGFLGLVSGNPVLVIIAIFIFFAASGEAQASGMDDLARRVRLRDAMITQFVSLGPQSNLGNAADALLATTQHEFPVLDGGGGLRGFLTRTNLVTALTAEGREAPVLHAMTGDIPQIGEGAPLTKALEAIQKTGAPAVAVMSSTGTLTGYVTRENLAELMMVHSTGS